jgi:hypothetical protein
MVGCDLDVAGLEISEDLGIFDLDLVREVV